MSRVIRIDDEVWTWLQSNAEPFEDTPNSVLRRVAQLDSEVASDDGNEAEAPMSTIGKGERTGSGRQLNVRWRAGAVHALYHKDGNYFNHLERFPGALFDPHGYVMFKTERDYVDSPYLQHGVQLHVPESISAMPGYVRKA